MRKWAGPSPPSSPPLIRLCSQSPGLRRCRRIALLREVVLIWSARAAHSDDFITGSIATVAQCNVWGWGVGGG